MSNFEWDEHKNKSNQQKHKIAFEDATDIFNDKDRLEYSSDKDGERRAYLSNKLKDAENDES